MGNGKKEFHAFPAVRGSSSRWQAPEGHSPRPQKGGLVERVGSVVGHGGEGAVGGKRRSLLRQVRLIFSETVGGAHRLMENTGRFRAGAGSGRRPPCRPQCTDMRSTEARESLSSEVVLQQRVTAHTDRGRSFFARSKNERKDQALEKAPDTCSGLTEILQTHSLRSFKQWRISECFWESVWSYEINRRTLVLSSWVPTPLQG